MASFGELVVPPTEEEILQRMLDVLQLVGFPVTSWYVGSVPHTLITAVAKVVFDLWLTIAIIARGATASTATGAWLRLLAKSQYDLDYLRAQFTVGTIRLSDNGGGPHTIAVGALYCATASGLKFRNTTGGTLPLNGTLDLTVTAEFAGAVYNVPNQAISVLVTALPTVTVANPEVGSTGTWITSQGSDDESDEALRLRCITKWSTLSTGSPPDAYIHWALSFAGVTRAKCVDTNPDGPNTLRVYIDSPGLVSTVQDYIQPAAGGGKAPAGTKATVVAATTVTVVIAGEVRVEKAKRASAEAEVAANLAAYQLAVNIGGTVREAQIVEEVMTPDGVQDFILTSGWVGTPNITLSPDQIPSFFVQLEWVEV